MVHTEDISLDIVGDMFVLDGLDLDHVEFGLHRMSAEFSSITHLGRLGIPELFPGVRRMERDLARHEVHDGRASLLAVNTDPLVFSSFGVGLDSKNDRWDVEVLVVSLKSLVINLNSPRIGIGSIRSSWARSTRHLADKLGRARPFHCESGLYRSVTTEMIVARRLTMQAFTTSGNVSRFGDGSSKWTKLRLPVFIVRCELIELRVG